MGRNPPRYRALLPTAPHGGPPLPASTSASDTVPKRRATRIACKECHEKKRKCDGQKPSCASCRRYDQPCTYRIPSSVASDEALRDELETLRGRYQVLESLVTKLRIAPQACAFEALRQMRSSPSGWPMDLDTTAQQSKVSSSRSTPTGLISPLSEPDRAASIQPSDLCAPAQDRTSALDSQPHVDLIDTDQGECCCQPQCPPVESPASPAAADAGLVLTKSDSDPRLKGLDMSFWTVVPVTDIFAKDALSSYLRSDHLIWELFDADSFLSDLVSQKFDFCSAFLVNCLMAFASQTYGADCPSATSKGLEFEKAAGALWQLEATRLDSETALTGLILLNLCFATRWETDDAEECQRQVFDMAVRMKLFGVHERVSDLDLSLLKADRKSSVVHAAWGAFNNTGMHRLRLLGDDSSLPPLVSLPGLVPSTQVSEIDDLPTGGIAQIDQGSPLVEIPSLGV